MDIESIRQRDEIYFLDRNAWNVNDPEALIVRMDVMEEDDGTLYADAEQDHVTLQLELTEEVIAQSTGAKYKYLFETRTEAEKHYNEEIRKKIDAINEMSKDALLQWLFDNWSGEYTIDSDIINAMKKRIKDEFNTSL